MWRALKQWLSRHGYTLTSRTAEYFGEFSARFNLSYEWREIWPDVLG
jgi:hypothetical protein